MIVMLVTLSLIVPMAVVSMFEDFLGHQERMKKLEIELIKHKEKS